MPGSLPVRVVTIEEDYWRIRSDEGKLHLIELHPIEQQELKAYFDEIRLPYRLFQGRPCVSDVVPWVFIRDKLEHFYDGRAEVSPF